MLQQDRLLEGLANGSPCSYLYLSDEGGLGPGAAVTEPYMGPLVLQAASRLKEMDVKRITIQLPGQAPSAQSAILSLELRIDGHPLNLLASRALWPVGQYLISVGDALL